MRICVNYCCLLFLILLYTKGHQGFFIKHSSGLCLQASSKYWLKGVQTGRRDYQWGPIYNVSFQNTCLHSDAQFRFFKQYRVLYNIAKDGTFLARQDKSDYKKQFKIYHSRQVPSATVFIFRSKFALKQTRNGALKLNSGYCPTPVVPGTSPMIRPTIPINGAAVYETTSCDQEENKFIFGSVTCHGDQTADVACHPDQVMVIQNAVYGGRPDMQTCGYNETTDCTVSVACLVKNLCNGKKKCDITVKNDLFKFDPCPEKKKYLYFEYICADTTEPVKELSVTDVRLSSSLLPNEGFLEINISNTRRNVCNTSLDTNGKDVVCRQLGYQDVKQQSYSPLTYLSTIFSGDINCYGDETSLSQCCVNNATKDVNCTSLAYVACLICSEPLLDDRVIFSDSIFTASSSVDNHTPAKARVSSNSSWCAPSNGDHHLDIDFGVIYVINSVTIFGDAVSRNWITSYKLSYMRDGTNFMEAIAGNNKVILANKNAYNDASTTKVDGKRARVLRFIPISSRGKRCMRIEICGHKLLPDQLRSLTLGRITSTTVTFSWIAPTIDKWEKPLLYFRIKIQETRSRSIVLYTNVTTNMNTKVVHNLSAYIDYELSIAAGNVYGFAKEKTISFKTDEAAPSGPPQNISVVAQSPTSFSVSWSKPEENKRNGIITNYTVCVSRFKDGPCFQRATIVDESLIIINLHISTKYFVKILASTKAGSGNFSDSNARFTNAEPLEVFVDKTSSTLSFILEIPSGNYSYFQVIVLKLSDSETPSSSPDNYRESDLISYTEAKNSPQPKPYIAAVFEMSNNLKKEFKLGDGKYYSLSTKRRRRSAPVVYYNGPLEPGTSYSVFQRVYKDKDNYFSTEWSPATRTNPTRTNPTRTNPIQTTSEAECSKTALYIVMAISVVINAVLIGVVVYLCCLIRQPRSETPTTKDKVVTNIENYVFTVETYESKL